MSFRPHIHTQPERKETPMLSSSPSRPRGARPRLYLLATIVAAFLLVPAGQAMAAPTLELNLIGINGGGGEVTSLAPLLGSPKVECELPEGGSQSGTCTTTMTPAEGGWAVWLNPGTPGPNSVIKEWVVHPPGIEANQCGPGAPECTVATENETETVVVDVEFERVKPTLTVNMVSIGGGGGEVISPSTTVPFPGTPPLACNLPEGGTQEGTCENLMDFIEPGVYGISTRAIAAPNSEFVEWAVGPGSFPEGTSCNSDPTSTQCGFVISEGEEVELEAIFACEAGKSCPPKPVHPLTITTSGSGSGVVECKVNGGAQGTCPTEVEEESDVEVIATPDTGSDPAELEGTGSAVGCSTSPCSFEMLAPSSVNAEFNLESLAFTVNQTGEGAVLCNGEACAATYTYGTAIEVTANAAAEQQLASINGGGSAAGKCEKESTTAGSCSFTIKAPSSVTVEFKSAATVAVAEGNVFGEVPQTTTLESACSEVDLGEFIPNAGEDIVYPGTCLVEVTATGEVNDLTAEDKTGNETGFLTQKPASPFTLESPLNVKGTALGGLGGVSGSKEALTSSVNLVHYPTPVSGDDVEVEFSQLIGEHEPLHTGVYAKTITLTLEQTTP